METYKLTGDVKVFGFQVTTFPLGIGEAFDTLKEKFPAGDTRSYYGISVCTESSIIYMAMAEEAYGGEAEKYGYESYIIPRGEYVAETITNWPQKVQGIKDVFAAMMKDGRVNNILPPVCVEWYKNMHEMLCLIKADKQEA